MTAYLLVVLTVFAVNLMPAFGPPTWAVLVLFTLNADCRLPLLVVAGAVAAAAGRFVLAHATRRLGRYLPARRRESLKAAGDLLGEHRGRQGAALALFAISPVPSAQLFEAAGLTTVRLVPLTAAFFVGRTVSYGIYAGGAQAVRHTSVGELLRSTITSPWGVAVQLVMIGGLVLLARVDWARVAARHGSGGDEAGR